MPAPAAARPPLCLSSCLVALGLLGACKDKGEGTDEPAGRFAAVGAMTPDDAAMIWVGGATSTAADGPLTEAWRYDLADDTWTALEAPPDATVRGVAAYYEGSLVTFGGSTSGWTEQDWLWRWEDNAGFWEPLSATGPEPRFKHAAALAGDTLYLTGGRNNDGADEVFYGDLWALDLDGMTWTELPGSGGPAGLHRHEMVWDEARGLLWVHAGFQPPADDPSGEPVRSDRTWTIDPETGVWTEVSWTGDGPPIRASHSAVMTDQGLLVWGGNASDQSVWVFDPEASTWTEHASSPAPLARDSQVTGVSSDGQTMVIVGGDPVSEEVPDFVADVWSLDVGTMTWTELRGIE